jgi:hypothetical protein
LELAGSRAGRALRPRLDLTPPLVLVSPYDPHRLGSMAHVDRPYHFLDRAFEYYVAGRFAALNTLQVAPNLFHHAVEVPGGGLADEFWTA